MAFNFPDTPAYGQTYAAYTWDGEKWYSTQGGSVSSPPNILTGLIGWWDASYTAGLTLTGANVDAVADRSGAGNDLGYVGTKPTYEATGLNSKPTFRFASSSGLRRGSFPIGTGTTLTLFIVCNLGTSGDGTRIMSYAADGSDYGGSNRWTVTRETSGTKLQIYRNPVSANATTTAQPSVHRLIITIDSSGVHTMYVDGVANVGGTTIASWMTGGIIGLAVTHLFGGPTNYWDGIISEAGIATGAASAAAVAELDLYLTNKWFTPAPPPPTTLLTGIVGWWDASNTAGLTLSGSDILSVADRSGAGNTMNWINGKPQYSATGLNSRPAFVFNTNNTAFIADPFPMGTGSTMTLWAVSTLSAGTTAWVRLLSYVGAGQTGDNNNVGSWGFGRQSVFTDTAFFDRNGGLVYAAGLAAHPALHRLILTVNSSGVATTYVDGAQAGTGTRAGNWISAGRLGLGAGIGTTVGWSGPVGEAGISTAYHSPDLVQQLDRYLKSKWGL